MTVSDVLVIASRLAGRCSSAVKNACMRKYRSTCWRVDTKKRTRENHLSREQEDEIKRFFAPYKRVTPIFHNFYTEANGQYSKYYIPDDIYYSYIDPFYNDWTEARYLDNKCLYPELFCGVEQARTFASRSNGIWTDGDLKLVSPDEIGRRLDSNDRIFAKVAIESNGGSGVFYLADPEQRKRFFKLAENRDIDFVLQYPIVQHPGMARLNPSSVNTVRILSYLDESGVKIYSSIVRMGRNGSKVDNASSGGITCGIDADGRLKKYAYNDFAVERFDAHPDTGTVFEGYPVPGIDGVFDAVRTLHPRIPHFRLISWDFAVDEEMRPVLIEVNLRYGGLDFHQINNGPVFGEDTEKILAEVFGEPKKR